MAINRVQDIPPERTYYVSPNFTDNTTTHEFSTIQAGIDAAYADWGPITDFSHTPIILVYPGKYTEQIHSYNGYHIQGFTHCGSPERKTAVLYNTGVDAAHYPLRGNDGDKYNIEGINIQVASGGVIGKISDGSFIKVNFRYGDFIEPTEVDNSYTTFKDCGFNQAGFNFTGAQITGRHIIQMNDCWLGQYTWITTSTHNDTAAFFINNCIFNQSYPNLGGDWKMQVLNSHVFGSDRTQIDTTTDISIIDSILSNGLHFVSDPANTKIYTCGFNDNEGYSITGEDITADVPITNVDYVGNVQQNGISGEIQTVGSVVNVGNSSINRYYSIQDAINSLPSGGIVSLQPGTYTEQIHSTGNVLIQGRTHEGVPAIKSTILYNTGVDAAHYPLRGNDGDKYNISDITIKTDADEVIGKLSGSNFTGVVFENGYFIEATANQALMFGLSACSFKNSMAFNLEGTGSGGMRGMTIIDCYFNDYATHWNFDSTHTSTLVIVKNTIFHNFYPDVGGNWKMEYSNSHVFGTSRTVINTSNRIAYIECILSNGLHFTSNPNTIIQLCTFNDDCGYAITGADITASVDVTDVNYVGNIQQNGLSGRIQIECPVKPVGCNAANKYYSLQDAVTSIVSKGTVELFTDLTGLAELTIPTNADVTIDAQGAYSLTFTNDIVEINNGSRCAFQNFVNLTGGEILLNGATAEASFEGCQYITAYLTISDGVFAIVYNSSFFGKTGYTPITISDLSCPVIVGYSRIQGPTGQPAVDFTVDADNVLKAKFSTFVHGDDASNSPIVNSTPSGKIDISIYNSALNAVWNAARFTNTIGSPNNTTDSNITF